MTAVMCQGINIALVDPLRPENQAIKNEILVAHATPLGAAGCSWPQESLPAVRSWSWPPFWPSRSAVHAFRGAYLLTWVHQKRNQHLLRHRQLQTITDNCGSGKNWNWSRKDVINSYKSRSSAEYRVEGECVSHFFLHFCEFLHVFPNSRFLCILFFFWTLFQLFFLTFSFSAIFFAFFGTFFLWSNVSHFFAHFIFGKGFFLFFSKVLFFFEIDIFLITPYNSCKFGVIFHFAFSWFLRLFSKTLLVFVHPPPRKCSFFAHFSVHFVFQGWAKPSLSENAKQFMWTSNGPVLVVWQGSITSGGRFSG